jgi:methionyl-tRNA synthetase
MPQLLVHGWWNLGGSKMSKSVGNVVDPFVLGDKYGSDALRYYLMSDIATGKDADFSEERLIERYNADLANSLGNLLNRTLNMAYRYRDGRLARSEDLGKLLETFEVGERAKPANLYSVLNLILIIGKHVGLFGSRFEELDPSFAVHIAIEIAINGNVAVERTAPWQLAKQAEKNSILDAALYTFADSLRIIAILISPVMPKAAHGIFDQLNWKMELSGKEERFSLADAEWGKLPDGHVVGKPVPLFPRIETSQS